MRQRPNLMAATLTPLTEDLAVDATLLAAHCDDLARHGVDGSPPAAALPEVARLTRHAISVGCHVV